jgi:hypothetical protein
MKWFPGLLGLSCTLLSCQFGVQAKSSEANVAHIVRYEDVQRFFRVYYEAGKRPTADALQSGYIGPGSAGVRGFVPDRIQSASALAEYIGAHPEIYDAAERCRPKLKRLDGSASAGITRFKSLYPEAIIPPVWIVIGRNNSGGTSTVDGVILGLEKICGNDGHDDIPFERRVASVIVHEIAHYSQRNTGGSSLLDAAIKEGGADFVAELATGHTSNEQLKRWTRGKEAGIEKRFRADMSSTDTRQWLYNGLGTAEQPGDLAYWVGYRIAKAYYTKARDKHAAIQRILTGGDAAGLLRDSGWNEQGNKRR